MINFLGILAFYVIPKSIMTMPVVVPTRMVNNRVKADAFNRKSLDFAVFASCQMYSSRSSSSIPVSAINIGLLLTLVILLQYLVKRTIFGVITFDLTPAWIPPLVVKIVI